MTSPPIIHDFAQLNNLFSDQDFEPTMVSIDFENLEGITGGFKKHNVQAGLAILDTRNCRLAASQGDFVKSFRATNLIVGKPNYYLENTTRSMYGSVEHVNKSDLANKIEDFIQRHSKPGRPLILVAHSVKGEVQCLQSLGFDMGRFDYVFDTYLIAHIDLKMKGPLKLVDLLSRFVPNTSRGAFHTAVNDAAFTLRCFVKLALDNISTFKNPLMKQGLLDFFMNGFESANNPPRIMPDLTDDKSREIHANIIMIVNKGKWKVPNSSYNQHLNNFVDTQDRAGSPKRIAQEKICRPVAARPQQVSFGPSASNFAGAQTNPVNKPASKPMKLNPSAPEFTFGTPQTNHSLGVPIQLSTHPSREVAPVCHNGVFYYHHVARPSAPEGMHPQYYMSQ